MPSMRGMANQQVPQKPSSSKPYSAVRHPAQAHGRKKRRVYLASSEQRAASGEEKKELFTLDSVSTQSSRLTDDLTHLKE